MKLNNSDQMESMVVILSKEKTPIAFEQRVLSLIDSGLERDEAEQMASDPIHVEMYYNPDAGLFLVECDAVESGAICDPYSGKLMDEFDEV
jgi:hypothetical protein